MCSNGISNFPNCETGLVKIRQTFAINIFLPRERTQKGIDECTLKLNRNRTVVLFSFRDTCADKQK